MAEKSTKNGKYAVRNIESLRATINREFIIRLHTKDGKSRLVGFTRFCDIVGDLHAEHFAKKAMKFTVSGEEKPMSITAISPISKKKFI